VPKKYAMPIYSHIRFLPGESQAYPGFIAGKNGYTNAAGQTFVGAAKRNGKTIIIALMHTESLWGLAKKLFDFGFTSAGKVQPVGKLVEPAGTARPQTQAQEDAIPTVNGQPAGDDSGGPDLLLIGVAGAFIAAGIAVLVVRRRRTA
jgi:D-alanyl-D-alanine carboxypeptidase (penicillin-binding protein 5/6)